jgi:transcriptional regulator with XRE-family HTH domain
MYEKFEELLSKHNITTYKVSKETGISQTTFTDWKNGKYTPKIDKLQKIAEFFSVNVSYFIEK